MSILFGIRKPVGCVVEREELLHLAQATARYTSSQTSVCASGRVGMGFQPNYTHARSRLDVQPAPDRYGNLVSFDGRLDNYLDLCSDLDLNLTSSDSDIALAAFLRWGAESFSRFIGDWALGLWSSSEETLYLSRDHAGTRSLYCQDIKGLLRWSTYLETFFVSDAPTTLDDDYMACYLASQPIRDRTPYKGVQAVLPGHYLALQDSKRSRRAHWSGMGKSRIRYRSDLEYERHFLALFRQSVERRTGPGAPVLAQLSGGMDSTSIVCMSDQIRRSVDPLAEILDTISFFDDSEPNHNDRFYFSLAEARRGKVGLHVQLSFTDRTFEPHDSSQGSYHLPGADSSAVLREKKIQTVVGEHVFRAILSGVGGDEVLGGVPSALPELATYLISGRFGMLIRRAMEWSLADRETLVGQLVEVAKYSFDLYRPRDIAKAAIPPWLQRNVQTRCLEIARQDVTRVTRLGLTPSEISNGLAWWSIMETLPHSFPGLLERPEYRYPYLDRDLIDYLFSIPSEQLIRPGRRRSLMRRSLKNIVPDEILERRRKAYQIRGPLFAFQHAQRKIHELFAESALADCGFIEPARLLSAFDSTTQGVDARWWQTLMRSISFELWLKSEAKQGTPVCTPSLPKRVLPMHL